MKALSIIYLSLGLLYLPTTFAQEGAPLPFGKGVDTAATGSWWKNTNKKQWNNLMVPRENVIGFALYTTHNKTLKITAQFYPLLADEEKLARLEIKKNNQWQEIATSKIHELGWSAHFRVENWDDSKDIEYRVLHSKQASYEGLIRKNPVNKEKIIVASLSCNSKKDRGDRETIVNNLKLQNPDLLFFAGDQSYDHAEHTAAWLQFGRQFGDVMRDRPTITIPDDHDVGQPNLWGEGGKVSTFKGGRDGGYALPAEYVKMVERCQTWHLPDAVDPHTIEQGIGVYFTSFNLGGIDFAILEDRKWKSGPKGKIPQQGPRHDHIRNPQYDPQSIDLEGLVLLGKRQLNFLETWAQDWTNTQMKCVLSQTPFAGAATNHGGINNRLHADLDSNGWPQTGRAKALTLIRKALAPHLCGDQHLGVTFQHGIDTWRDGPWCHSSPAIVNTIYSRYWLPLDENRGPNSSLFSELEFSGDYYDGFRNKITMGAYSNPDVSPAKGSGYSLAYFNKKERSITFENWSADANVAQGDQPLSGWPITIKQWDNDGRKALGNLGLITVEGIEQPVFQVVHEATGDILYTYRPTTNSFNPKVYAKGTYTVNIGEDKPNQHSIKGLSLGGAPITVTIK